LESKIDTRSQCKKKSQISNIEFFAYFSKKQKRAFLVAILARMKTVNIDATKWIKYKPVSI